MKRRSPTTRVRGAYVRLSHMSHPPIVMSIIAPSSLFPQNVGSSNVPYLRAPWIIWGPLFSRWRFDNLVFHQAPGPATNNIRCNTSGSSDVLYWARIYLEALVLFQDGAFESSCHRFFFIEHRVSILCSWIPCSVRYVVLLFHQDTSLSIYIH